jgi:hypothetical protein
MTKTNQRLLAVFGVLALVTVFAVAREPEDELEPKRSAPVGAVPEASLLDNPDIWERCTKQAERRKPTVCALIDPSSRESRKRCAQLRQHDGAWEALRCLRDAQEREVERLRRANR